jgi:shikimate dehydrogenase
LHPVSLGARMHLAGYAALELPFTYVPFAVKEADIQGALHGMRALGIRGFGVSMPFKLQVMPMLDRLDELARRIGAVNTIVNDEGVLTGYNTDAWGAVSALSEVTSLAGKRATVIGAGGAARAVVFALRAEGVQVHVVNRTVGKAERLSLEVSAAGGGEPLVTAGPLEDLGDLAGFDILVNCSSAGMAEYQREPLVTRAALHSGLVVMDIVYKPIETRLIRVARELGLNNVHGGRMLLHQACRQFELYTGRPAPVAEMESAQHAAISEL